MPSWLIANLYLTEFTNARININHFAISWRKFISPFMHSKQTNKKKTTTTNGLLFDTLTTYSMRYTEREKMTLDTLRKDCFSSDV